jgi:hypothetical protein
VPGVEAVTLTDTAQVAPAARLPPLRLIVVAFAGAEKVPPQVLVAAGVEATCIPEGRGSLTATPVSVEMSVAKAVSVSVKVEEAPGAMFTGEKALVIEGGALPDTTRVDPELATMLLPLQPPPALFPTSTLNGVVLGGVSEKVVIVRTEDVLPLETVDGLNVAIVSALGGVQTIIRGFETQLSPVPVHAVEIEYVAELP